MKWSWNNRTQVSFGCGIVSERLRDYIAPGSTVFCTFGSGSINHNGARDDVQRVLDELQCNTVWFGGIEANPEYDRCMEIAEEARKQNPSAIIAVGGGSVLDGTKFIALAADYSDGDPWRILTEHAFPTKSRYFGAVMTLPATGSEWNNSFVLSRRSMKSKLAVNCDLCYPVFSLLDPRYTMTLPLRQLRNGVFDSFAHCVDQFLTGQEVPLIDSYWLSTMKEIVDISGITPDSSIKLHERLMMVASFALNYVFTLGKEDCWAMHRIGHQITAQYGIDHAATLSMVMPYLLETQFEDRKSLLAKTAEYVFNIHNGIVDEKARACIQCIRDFARSLSLPLKVSDVTTVNDGDKEEVFNRVIESVGGGPFGFRKHVTPDDLRYVLDRVLT